LQLLSKLAALQFFSSPSAAADAASVALLGSNKYWFELPFAWFRATGALLVSPATAAVNAGGTWAKYALLQRAASSGETMAKATAQRAATLDWSSSHQAVTVYWRPIVSACRLPLITPVAGSIITEVGNAELILKYSGGGSSSFLDHSSSIGLIFTTGVNSTSVKAAHKGVKPGYENSALNCGSATRFSISASQMLMISLLL
jgi:hypothetical protein